ncbi:GGDEF domain-containing protein [Micromonospora echinofusca]|uniref:GGDEF domain-containing protein, diguanylate cyclase (C-di-GMP synthetase) or its enzymatically inactive variants n=1 Tax=Micromonospora echinofusca TaxID=47858 RepID=A0A1C5GI34_MICEH|nr:GGDEF domain-containing protein [Micromonospora echinofusca]SCG19465.1 GGDEF domain-containing protein, diguanylate cyclase (c-di-GMP synthetase) or its enzymatically inactive variants [Micromonospora echinofusca]
MLPRQLDPRRWEERTPQPLPTRGWCRTARQDPITGLVAFPDFNAALPTMIGECFGAGQSLGLAIGDVDGLKEYVERSRDVDPRAFGHMAGCALMNELGSVAAQWFDDMPYDAGCVATFGGDEVIVAVRLDRQERSLFPERLGVLRDRMIERLPRTVSFGYGVFPHDTVLGERDDARETADLMLGSVDQMLFREKAAVRAAGRTVQGFLITFPVPHG